MTLQEAQAYYCELYRANHPGKDPRKSHNYKELELVWAAKAKAGWHTADGSKKETQQCAAQS